MAPEPELAESVAAAVLAHPGVVRLSGGAFGSVASYLPGRRLLGVRLPLRAGDPVEVSVVTRIGVPLPAVAAELGAAVVAAMGHPVAVDVTVTDVEIDAAAAGADAVGGAADQGGAAAPPARSGPGALA